MNNSSQHSSSSRGLADAANATGLTVLICTILLGFVFTAVIMCKARSRYREYMLGSTTTTQQPHQQQQQQQEEDPVIISLYPALPSSSSSSTIARVAEDLPPSSAGEDNETKPDDPPPEDEMDEVFEIHETRRYLMTVPLEE